MGLQRSCNSAMKVFLVFVVLFGSSCADFDAFRDVKVWLHRDEIRGRPIQLELGNVELLASSGFDIFSTTIVVIDGWFDDVEVDFANKTIREILDGHGARAFFNVRNETNKKASLT